ncbi:aminoacyl-histidine dipeptidase [Chitinophaga qingshengii]|uniref:Aminoacyl-histidine dipeptidase n=1 Tax=Chitinophaga qingshengii TaxID=1569794 RepID=A0ABR7TWX0_9BACT|nr:aminoacyl-histidine dipeptidase [Chitinophaga qingshengii]MBC9934971.1 aminoacyl-histidine dipeptidase [Chitinophaga qingshengii]
MELTSLAPQPLWQYFSQLNAIPRASKKEEKVVAFMEAFGQQLGLETKKDAVGNVCIKKPATAGMEDRQTVILQSHLDMVHQKNNDTVFDFDTQGIDMYVDGDWVRARGTTLGADNGIGVATIMAILASKDIPHPAIEAMFTIDEETGMTGAMQLDPAPYTGKILLNLDTEEDDEITIGCAGGLDTNSKGTYQQVPALAGGAAYDIIVKGLLGGHSGMDINRGRANANKLMNRLLFKARQSFDVQLASLDGGSLRNAIPRESHATVVVPGADKAGFEALVNAFAATLQEEYKSVEEGLTVEIKPVATPASVVEPAYFDRLLRAIYAIPNGVFRMSPDIPGLVETSNNLAKVIVKDGQFITQSLQRSNVDSTKEDVALAVRAALENMGCEVMQVGGYPGWKPNPDSAILQVLLSLHGKHFDSKPKVGAIHAGLECGILGSLLNGPDMISFGPTIRGAHSPKECVQISSVKLFYAFLLDILKEIPKQ